jgi:hypothetical protein
MAANAVQDLVRALTEGDASRDVTAVPLNRMPDRRTPRVSTGRIGARRDVSRGENDKNKIQGE